MQRSTFLMLGLAWAAVPVAASLTTTAASAAGLGEAAELEHARANARAGGPISSRDKELLERYGCLSGTNSPACGPAYRHEEPRPAKKRKWKRY